MSKDAVPDWAQDTTPDWVAKPSAAPAAPSAAALENQARGDAGAATAATNKEESLVILQDQFQKAQQAYSAALASGEADRIAREKANVEGAAREINRVQPGAAPNVNHTVPGRMATAAKTVGQNMTENELAQRGAYGTLGAGTAMLTTGAPIALYRTAMAVKKALENRVPPAPAGTSAAPSAAPAAAVPEVTPGAGTTSGTSVVPPSEQTIRILQGGDSDTKGTSGRARQTGYNIQTAQEAAIKAQLETLMRGGMSELDARAYLANMPGLTATESGVIAPRTAPVPTAGPRFSPSVWRRERAIGPPPWVGMGSPTVGDVRPGAGGTPAPAAPAVPPPPPLPAAPAGPSVYESALNAVKDYGTRAGRTFADVAQHPLAVSGAVGFGVGSQAPEIMEHLNKKDYGGVAADIGKGAAYGTIPALLPAAVQRGLAVAGPMAGAGMNIYDAGKRALNSDYTGSMISGAGGLAALAPLAISGPVGWTVGGLGMLTPAIINYLRDKEARERAGGGRGFVNPQENYVPTRPVAGRDSSRMSP